MLVSEEAVEVELLIELTLLSLLGVLTLLPVEEDDVDSVLADDRELAVDGELDEFEDAVLNVDTLDGDDKEADDRLLAEDAEDWEADVKLLAEEKVCTLFVLALEGVCNDCTETSEKLLIEEAELRSISSVVSLCKL